jgi:hypothetical protein
VIVARRYRARHHDAHASRARHDPSPQSIPCVDRSAPLRVQPDARALGALSDDDPHAIRVGLLSPDRVFRIFSSRPPPRRQDWTALKFQGGHSVRDGGFSSTGDSRRGYARQESLLRYADNELPLTLILSSVIDSRIFIATDSHRGILHGAPDVGEKAVVWLDGQLVLTGFGDFHPHPLGLHNMPGLADRLQSSATHHGRSTIITESLARGFRAREGCRATCLLFGFEALSPVVSRIVSTVSDARWEHVETRHPHLAAGRLEALGYPPDIEIATLTDEFANEASFSSWASRQIESAANWSERRDPVASVRLPMRSYRMLAK